MWKQLLCTAILAHASSGVSAASGTDESYPSKPIRMVVGAPPGGASDAFARIVSPRLAELLGQQVVIDNRAGANNNIACELVARAQPDGYTLLWVISQALVVNPALYKNLPFDPQKDLAPILYLGAVKLILVAHRSVPANSMKELIALVKAKPGQFKYASGGVGSPGHLAGELLRQKAGLDIIHVPYKGGGPATVAVLSGETDLYFATPPSPIPHIKAGTLKALAYTGLKRSPVAPDIPTMQELGFPDFDVGAGHGVLTTAGTPKPIVARLSRELSKVMSMPDVQEALKRDGLDQSLGTPEQFAAYIKRETVFWAKVVKDAGIKPE